MDLLNPRAVIGGNAPPLTPFEAHAAHIGDLYAEAKNWCDGEPIATQAQHDEVERLLDLIREAHEAADESRRAENQPFDAGKAEVQARYAPLISDTKAVTGKTVAARAACLAVLGPWRKKVAAAKAAEAKRLQDEAEAKIRLAQQAAREAEPSDLANAEAVDQLLSGAQQAQRDAAMAVKASASGTGLRSYWTPVLTDPGAALRHYLTTRPDALKDYLVKLAEQDVREGKRSLPGFDIREDKRAV